jgi:hypothetical protein
MQRSEGWQGARVGAVSAKMLLVLVLARKRRLDLVTVRAVAERRPSERRGVDEKTRSLPHFLEMSVVYLRFRLEQKTFVPKGCFWGCINPTNYECLKLCQLRDKISSLILLALRLNGLSQLE